jgi:arylsulfatase A-like enzyme
LETTGDRLDDETMGALGFLKRNHDKPFFLYLAYSGPHTPLAATKERLDRFPGEMKERRRIGLAMISTMDDGVGQIMALLKKYNIEENTLIFFTSDNGAPTKMTKPDDSLIPDPDSPNQYNVGGWDGSLNDPHLGEKGMLTEGGIRVPFIVSWKGTLPAGKVYDEPVSALDIAPTALAVAGLPEEDILDGDNIIPILTGKKERSSDHALFWRFWKQSAVRQGDWKLIHLGDGKDFLFNLKQPESPELDLSGKYPEKVEELKAILEKWTEEIRPPGLPQTGIQREKQWYNFYLNHGN